MLEIVQLKALTDNYIYLVHDHSSGKTAVIDPTLAEPVLSFLQEKNWHLDYVFNTHHHSDHIGGNLELKKLTGCRIVAPYAERKKISGIDVATVDGEQFLLGNQLFQVITTPGHTLGHIVYYCENSHALFCGDTLFSLGCGRLFEGSAEQMWQSLQRLKALPVETKVYCAHEYTLANGQFAITLDGENPALQKRVRDVAELRTAKKPTVPSTLEEELSTNPFLRENALSIRLAVGLNEESGPVEVFARIRKLKDNFR